VKGIALEEGRIDEQFPERVKLKGLAQMKYDMRCFIGLIPNLYRDLADDLIRNPVDVMVGDTAAHACGLAAQRHGLPWAAYGISVFLQRSRDTAPFGLGLPPSSSPLGRLRNAFLYWLVDQLIFKDPFEFYDETAASLGLGKQRYSVLEFSRAANLFLQCCTPSFEYPRSDMPENVRFIGPAIQSLAGEDVLVIATTGSRPAAELGSVAIPANVVVEQFVPYGRLMPRVSLLVTNGGYGTLHTALAHGVPIVVFAGSEEKPEIACRVGWSGVGLGYRTKRPSPEQIRSAVRKALDTPAYRTRSQEFAAEIRQYDTPKVAADMLESLVGRK
jgi:UDP:flavonoid glycosyltransferase YjiC (YdhE family)